ncbi:MAG: hypothetical protein EOP48_27370 [Sphingobacteriales bacterium]|nr:MAG: hypothetical protein EOP48_27370 [Sphingobacteriales bacterium]
MQDDADHPSFTGLLRNGQSSPPQADDSSGIGFEPTRPTGIFMGPIGVGLLNVCCVALVYDW